MPGTGCPNCIRLENMCREVVAENNLDAAIEKVSNFDDHYLLIACFWWIQYLHKRISYLVVLVVALNAGFHVS